MCMPAQQPSGGGQVNTGAAALTGAASGASMGAMLGPWGAAAGAVGGAAMGVIGSKIANKNAKATEEARRIAQEQAMAENRRRATTDYLNQIRLENVQMSQEQAAVVEKTDDLGKNTANAVGAANVSAAERGVGGRSLDQIISDYHAQNDLEVGRLNANQGMKDAQHGEVVRGANQNYWNRVTGMQPYQKQPVAPVDYFSPAFKLVGDLGKIGMASGVGQGGGSVPTSSAPSSDNSTSVASGFALDRQDG